MWDKSSRGTSHQLLRQVIMCVTLTTYPPVRWMRNSKISKCAISLYRQQFGHKNAEYLLTQPLSESRITTRNHVSFSLPNFVDSLRFVHGRWECLPSVWNTRSFTETMEFCSWWRPHLQGCLPWLRVIDSKPSRMSTPKGSVSRDVLRWRRARSGLSSLPGTNTTRRERTRMQHLRHRRVSWYSKCWNTCSICGYLFMCRVLCKRKKRIDSMVHVWSAPRLCVFHLWLRWIQSRL